MKNNNRILVVFLGVWFILQLLSGYFTELYNDEAYYWVYSQHLDWGYFDHPPMVGTLIKVGTFLIDNELGVRLPFIILSTWTIYLLYLLVAQDIRKFIFLILGIFPFHLLGFMALPDMPFLFFATFFFYIYQKYLENDTWLNAFGLAVAISGMFYSKYHAILIVIFTIVSNWQLFKRKTFYFATIMTLVLFAPNIIWQIVNDYPSIEYHFFQRSAKVYHFSFTTEYVLGQLFFYGPFVSLFMWFFTIKKLFQKSENAFQKALKYNLIGVFLFFLLISLKGRVEVNWTIPFLAPLIILSYDKISLNRWLIGLSIFTFSLTLLIRIHLVTPLMNFENERGHEFRGHKEFAKEVKEKSEGLPIVANSYQKAGVLSFYLKEPITSFNIQGRKNLFGMLDFADSLNGKKIAFVNGHLPGNPINVKGHETQITILENASLYRNISIEWLNHKTFIKDNKSQILIKKLNSLVNITCNKRSFLLILIEQDKQKNYRKEIDWKESYFNKPYYFSFENNDIDFNKPYKVSFTFITDGMGRWWSEEYLFKGNFDK